MIPSIVSIGPKQTPPPPSRNNHRRRHHLHDRLATRRDINPATYYMESHSGNNSPTGRGLPRPSRPSRSSKSNTNRAGSATCINLLSHANQTDNDHPPVASSSVTDLWSYTQQAQQSYFDFMDPNDFHLRDEYDEFNHHNEFAVSPNASASNLYEVVKAQNAHNKKRYKQHKIRSNISNYMRYMTMNDGNERSADETRYDLEPTQPAFMPPLTTFDCVSDIFNLIPPHEAHSSQKQTTTRQEERMNDRDIAMQQQQPVIEDDSDGTQTPHPPLPDRPSSTAASHRSFIDKVRKIFNEHEIDGAPTSDNDAVFESIADICQDLVHKRSRMRHYEHKYKHLERFLSRLERENDELKQKNDQLEHRLNYKDRTDITKHEILEQVSEYLSDLEGELIVYAAKRGDGGNVYRHFKVKLKGMYESLTDLAQDLNEKELHNAVNKLKKGIEDIEFLEHHGLYKHNHLQTILQGLTKEFEDIPRYKATPGGLSDMKEEEKECGLAEKDVFDDEKKEEEESIQFDEHSLTKYGVFEEECPRVVRIDIDGGWFNKKTRAIIKYRGKVFGRKEADFKWFYKMLQCDFNWLGSEEQDSDSNVIPDFNKELPHTMWHDNYLTKRKRELNLFLMQCHSLKNINSGTPYHIFLEHDKDEWKYKRNEFDQIMLQRLKQTGR